METTLEKVQIAQPRKEKHRLNYIDIARGIVTILVIIGHLSLYGGVLYRYIFIFHMPFFFFISGWCTAISPKVPALGKYLMRSVKSILVPALIVRAMCTAEVCGGLGLIETVKIFFHPYTEWFLPTLFAARVCFGILLKISSFLKTKTAAVIMFGSVVLSAPLVAELCKQNGLHMWRFFPVSLDCAAVGIAFVIIGYFAKKLFSVNGMSVRLPRSDAVAVAAVLVFVLGLTLFNNPVNICDGEFENGAFILLAATLLCLSVNFVSSRLDALNSRPINAVKKFLAFFGRHSLPIYVGHRYINMIIVYSIKKLTGTEYALMTRESLKIAPFLFAADVIGMSLIMFVYDKVKKAIIRKSE